MSTAGDPAETMAECWAGLAPWLSLDAAPAAVLLAGLQCLHSAPERHYHGTQHIAALLDLLDRHIGLARDPDTIRLAMLFHDAVYDPASNPAPGLRWGRQGASPWNPSLSRLACAHIFCE